MENKYIKGHHYTQKETVHSLEFRLSHWEDDEKLNHILQIGVDGGLSKATTSTYLYPSVDELRRLSAMFSAAADDLEAHAAFIKARDEAKAGEAA